MTNEPTPIETTYNGYRFRSRTEARWAVALDALGVAWEYEPEGYDLGLAGWYLPDFRINSRVWLEVKNAGIVNKLATIVAHVRTDKGRRSGSIDLLDVPATAEWLAVEKPVHLVRSHQTSCYVVGGINDHDQALVLVPHDGRTQIDSRPAASIVGLLSMAFGGDKDTAVRAARSARFERGSP